MLACALAVAPWARLCIMGAALGALACSGSGGGVAPAAPGDAGDAGRRSPTAAATAPAPESRATGVGAVTVAVEWREPPARALRSAGPDRCGGERRAALSVHSAGGVRDAVVALEDAAEPELQMPTIVIHRCRPVARMTAVVGAPWRLRIVNRDERAHSLRLVADGEVLAKAELRVFGQTYELEGQHTGMIRIDLGQDEGVGYVFASSRGQLAVTDGQGVASFAEVAAGKTRVTVLHRPLEPGGEPLERAVDVDVVAGKSTQQRVSLAP